MHLSVSASCCLCCQLQSVGMHLPREMGQRPSLQQHSAAFLAHLGRAGMPGSPESGPGQDDPEGLVSSKLQHRLARLTWLTLTLFWFCSKAHAPCTLSPHQDGPLELLAALPYP